MQTMTYEEIAAMLEDTMLPFSYRLFRNKNVSPPFLIFYYPDRDDFLADDTVYQKIESLRLELYTDNKDFELENRIEQAMLKRGLIFEKSETYIDSEQMFEIIYDTEVLINEYHQCD